MSNQTIGEYFCGAGGLSLGALLATQGLSDEGLEVSVDPRWAIDNSRAACETYEKNFVERMGHDTRVIHADVREVVPEQLEKVDGFLFGFPCNDFSIVGEHLGTDGDFGPLYKEAVKYLEVGQPDWFVAENVSGLKSANNGKAFKVILNAFENAGPGYEISHHLYKFEQYGVPQTRHRIIVVGIKKSLPFAKYFRPPEPLTTDPSEYKTARQALSGIPSWAKNNDDPKISDRVRERLSYIKPGQNAFNAKIPEELSLHVRAATLSHIYRKLDPDKPSYTLTANGGGGTHGYHWQGGRRNVKANRALTARERARIQTFPDDFVFYGGPQEVRSQVGMAVPPEGAKYIFESLFRLIHGANSGNKLESPASMVYVG